MGGEKKFITVTLDLNNKIFIIYIVFLANTNLNNKVNSFCRTQIILLKASKASIIVLSKYTNFVDIFSLDLGAKLPKYI